MAMPGSTGQPTLTLSRVAFDAVLFDLDGVITRTAKLHIAAWKTMFDDYLEQRAPARETFQPFDPDRDYREFVDGKARHDGVVGFLASRGIVLPLGDPGDPPERESVWGLANRKNRLYLDLLATRGVEVFPSTLTLIRRLRALGFKVAVVSASKNCAEVLRAAGIAALFDARVDGLDLERDRLRGKPAPDSFLAAARRLGVDPARAVVVEDAIAGVQAGRAGRFGGVLGVDRTGHRDALAAAGAHWVVADLEEVAAVPA